MEALGLVLVPFGVGLIYVPAAIILAGILCLCASYLLVRGEE